MHFIQISYHNNISSIPFIEQLLYVLTSLLRLI